MPTCPASLCTAKPGQLSSASHPQQPLPVGPPGSLHTHSPSRPGRCDTPTVSPGRSPLRPADPSHVRRPPRQPRPAPPSDTPDLCGGLAMPGRGAVGTGPAARASLSVSSLVTVQPLKTAALRSAQLRGGRGVEGRPSAGHPAGQRRTPATRTLTFSRFDVSSLLAVWGLRAV